MRKFVFFLTLFCMILTGCSISKTDNEEKVLSLNEKFIAAKDYDNTIELADSVEDAVVGIVANTGYGDSVGSGVCVAGNGYILTNSHVISNSNGIVVYLSNGDRGEATVVWEDSSQDLAIIKTNKTLPYLPISSDGAVSVGETVVAVGTPLSLILKHSFTKGIVSAINRTIKVETASGETYMQNLIQHDASINPGNSGGPLINLKGEVVGINTLKISGGEGIGFAIPSNTFNTLVVAVINSNGEYQTPYVGAYGFDAEIAKFNSLTNEKEGFYIVSVADNSPLKAVGITDGVVVKKINDRVITNAADMRNELYKYCYGDKLKISFINNGSLQEKTIILSKNYLR